MPLKRPGINALSLTFYSSSTKEFQNPLFFSLFQPSSVGMGTWQKRNRYSAWCLFFQGLSDPHGSFKLATLAVFLIYLFLSSATSSAYVNWPLVQTNFLPLEKWIENTPLCDLTVDVKHEQDPIQMDSHERNRAHLSARKSLPQNTPRCPLSCRGMDETLGK